MDIEPAAAASSSADNAASAPVIGRGRPMLWSAALIFAEFTSEPQSADQIHKALMEKHGAFLAVPPLRVVQAALSSRGEKNGGARLRKGNAALWVKASAMTASGGGAGTSGIKKPKRAIKLTSKMRKGEEQTPKERAVTAKTAAQQKAQKLLLQPMTPFMLFSFSQRGVMKKHKEPIRDVVKAISERWLMLTDEERARYAKMADDDKSRCEKAVEAAARLAEQQAEEAAEAEHDEEAEGGGEGDDDAEESDEEEAGGPSAAAPGGSAAEQMMEDADDEEVHQEAPWPS